MAGYSRRGPHTLALAELLPTAEVHVIEDAGHVAVLDGFPGWLRTLAQD